MTIETYLLQRAVDRVDFGLELQRRSDVLDEVEGRRICVRGAGVRFLRVRVSVAVQSQEPLVADVTALGHQRAEHLLFRYARYATLVSSHYGNA